MTGVDGGGSLFWYAVAIVGYVGALCLLVGVGALVWERIEARIVRRLGRDPVRRWGDES